jgi:hypothetical protein
MLFAGELSVDLVFFWVAGQGMGEIGAGFSNESRD